MKALPDSIRPWVPGPMISLGTDGFGRSDTRAALRDFFEVDARHIAWAALVLLYREKKITKAVLEDAQHKLKIDPDKKDPVIS
jgi:pyruvate dehydrogenase E1 component